MKITSVQVEEFVDLCMTAKTIDLLVKNSSLSLKAMGFSSMNFHYIPHLGAHDYNEKKIAHVPEEHKNWIMDTFPKYMFVSPRDPFESYVLKNGQTEWIDDLKNREDFNSTKSQAFLKTMLTRFGPSFIVPAFGPRRSRGYFLLPINQTTHKPNFQTIVHLEYICSFFHRRYNKLQTALGEPVSLTPREHEVLHLIPFGLSSSHIGKILKISTNTVNGHVKQIFTKMGVTDRLSASLRAFSLDLID